MGNFRGGIKCFISLRQLAPCVNLSNSLFKSLKKNGKCKMLVYIWYPTELDKFCLVKKAVP